MTRTPAPSAKHPPAGRPNVLPRAITATKLSVRQFAKFIIREPRSVYRWLQLSDDDLPSAVRDRCNEILATDPAKLREEVDAWIVKQFYQRHARKNPRSA